MISGVTREEGRADSLGLEDGYSNEAS